MWIGMFLLGLLTVMGIIGECRKNKGAACVCYLLAILALMITVSVSGADDITLRSNEYCEMTALFKTTRGDLGWPDFHGTAKELCDE